MIKINFIPYYCRHVILHTMRFGLFEAFLAETRWAVSISKMETSLIPNAENSRTQRLAAHAPHDRRANNFEAVVLERFDGSGDFVAISEKPCPLLILLNSCCSFTSVSYWSLIKLYWLLFVTRQIRVVCTCNFFASSMPVFFIPSSWVRQFLYFYI